MTQIFLRGSFFVPQISQITQIFLRGSFLSHRFHRFTQIFLRRTYSTLRGYLHRPNRSLLRKSVSNRLRKKTPNKFRVIRWIKFPDEKNLRHLRNLRDKKLRWTIPMMRNLCKSVKSVGHIPLSGGICTDRIGRLRENPWVIALAGNLRINSVSSDE